MLREKVGATKVEKATCGALPGEIQSSGILPFQSASLRFPAVWPNASLRTGLEDRAQAFSLPEHMAGVEGPVQIWRTD